MKSTKDFLGHHPNMGGNLAMGVVEDRNDPQQLGRVRVRFYGIHTDDKTKIPTEALPWAVMMHPVTSATTSGIGNSPSGLVEGNLVVGIFLDGEDCQVPMIIGSISNTGENLANINNGASSGGGQGSQSSTDNEHGLDRSKKGDVPSAPKGNVGGGVPGNSVPGGVSYNNPNAHPRVQSWMNFGMNDLGLSPMQASQFVGGLQAESGPTLNPAAFNSSGGGQGALGTAQWRGPRQAALRRYADHLGKPVTDVSVQQGYAKQEFTNGPFAGSNESAAYRDLKAAKTPAQAARAAASYERYDDWQTKYGKRQANGERIYNNGEFKTNDPNQTGFEGSPETGGGQQPPPEGQESEKTGFADPTGNNDQQEPNKDSTAYSSKDQETTNNPDEDLKESIRKKECVDVANGENGGDWQEPKSQARGSYPYTKTIRTESGHVIMMDDTGGSENITIMHRTGSHIEMGQDGSVKYKNHGDSYFMTDRNGYMHVDGRYNLNVAGQGNLSIGADANIQINGNSRIVIGNDANIEVSGGANINVGELAQIKAQGIKMESSKGIDIVAAEDIRFATEGKLHMRANGMRFTSVADIQTVSATDTRMQSYGAFHQKAGEDVYVSAPEINLKAPTKIQTAHAEGLYAGVITWGSTDSSSPTGAIGTGQAALGVGSPASAAEQAAKAIATGMGEPADREKVREKLHPSSMQTGQYGSDDPGDDDVEGSSGQGQGAQSTGSSPCGGKGEKNNYIAVTPIRTIKIDPNSYYSKDNKTSKAQSPVQLLTDIPEHLQINNPLKIKYEIFKRIMKIKFAEQIADIQVINDLKNMNLKSREDIKKLVTDTRDLIVALDINDIKNFIAGFDGVDEYGYVKFETMEEALDAIETLIMKLHTSGITSVRDILIELFADEIDGIDLRDLIAEISATIGVSVDATVDITNKENLALIIGMATNALNGQGIDVNTLISKFGIDISSFSGKSIKDILGKFNAIDVTNLSELFKQFTNVPILKKSIDWIEKQNDMVDPDTYFEKLKEGQRKHHEDVYKRGGQKSRNSMQALIDAKGGLIHPKATHGGKDRLATPIFKIISQSFFVKPDGEVVNFAPTVKAEEVDAKGYVPQPSAISDRIYNKTSKINGDKYNPKTKVSSSSSSSTATTNKKGEKYVGKKGTKYKTGMKLSENFIINDLTSGRSHPKLKGRRFVPLFPHRFDGRDEHIANLAHIANNVLEPLLKKYGADLIINSAWRPFGKSRSQHNKGEAVDISVKGYDWNMYPIANEIKNLVPYDQFILEYNKSSWIHISLKRKGGNRKSVFTMNRHRKVGGGLINMRRGRL